MSILANIRIAAFVSLLILVSLFGWQSYRLSGKLAVATDANTRIIRELEESVEREELARASCQISSEITYSVNVANEGLMDSRTSVLEALNKVSNPTPQDKRNEAAEKLTEAPTQYADGGRLSPSLMRLLDTAYCSGDRESIACATKGTTP